MDNRTSLTITLNDKIYEKRAILEASYKFTDKCSILVEPYEETGYRIIFHPKEGQDGLNLTELQMEFYNQVLDYQLRIELEKTFGSLREKIVSFAFWPASNK